MSKKKKNKKTDSQKKKALSLAMVLAILEIVNTILDILQKVCK